MPEDRFKRLPSALVPLVKWDEEISRKMALCATPKSPLARYRKYMKWLEISCHGIPWLTACIAGLWLPFFSGMKSILLNLLIALLIDVMVVALTKALVRRGRPKLNREDNMFSKTVLADKYSFPSGHATRAVMIMLLVWFSDTWFLFKLVVIVWGSMVCNSRVLLGRHHFLDVVAAIVLGAVQTMFVSMIWMSPETASDLYQWLSREDGADVELS